MDLDALGRGLLIVDLLGLLVLGWWSWREFKSGVALGLRAGAGLACLAVLLAMGIIIFALLQ